MTQSDMFGWFLVSVMFLGALYLVWWNNWSASAKKRDEEAARGIGEFAGRLIAGAIRESMFGKERR